MMQPHADAPDHSDAPARRVLDHLVEERLPAPQEPYAYFWIIGEGFYLPELIAGIRIETCSGYVLDAREQLFRFWLAWDPVQRRPILTRWYAVHPQADWATDREYQDARRHVGLPVTAAR